MMNLSYKILFILLLPIYVAQAMEEENKTGTLKAKDDAQGLPSGLIQMAELMVQAQSAEVQDPRGTYGRSNSAASLHRTPTVTTVGSTPATSMPASRAQLPGLPTSTSQAPSPSTSATKLPGLDPALNASNPDFGASMIPSNVYAGPGDDESIDIMKNEIGPFMKKCTFLWTPPVKKRVTKSISQSTDEKSSGGEKSGEEKTSPKKARSGTGLETVNKELPTSKEEFYPELLLKIHKAILVKLNMLHHDSLFGRGGFAPIANFLGMRLNPNDERSVVPVNSLAVVLKDAIKDALTDYKADVDKANFKKDCFIYTALAANFAMSTAVFAVGLANYYS